MHIFRHTVAWRFYSELAMDQQPGSMAVIVDFFPAKNINGTMMKLYYDAYNRGVRSAADLDNAVGNGAQLTELVRRVDPSLDPIVTSYDLMKSEDDEGLYRG